MWLKRCSQHEAGREDCAACDDLITYRQPFVDFLMKDCHMSLDDIKVSVSKVKEKNIPTKVICDKVRDIILSGVYWIE